METTKIEAYIGNPIIHNQSEYNELLAKINPIDNKSIITLYKDRMQIVVIRRRTIKYPKTPTIDWVVERFRKIVSEQL